MKLFKKRQKLGNRGLSMIELLCSLAIMSILGMVAGSMLIVSANSYQRENADTDAQKEAQLVANQISDLLIDTTAEVETSDSVVNGRNRTDLLTIIQGTAGYEVEFDAVANKLYYRQFIVDAAGNKDNYTSKQLMAENLINFYADVAAFKETGNVKLDMVYAKGAGEYPAVFTVTARNKELMAGTAPAVYVSVPTEIILEPNQTHTISATTSGAPTNLKWSIVDAVTTNTSINEDTGVIEIGKSESANMFRVRVATTTTDESGNPLVVKYVRVYVRKVTDIQTSGTLTSGIAYKSGAVYSVDSQITGNNLEQAIGQTWDSDYIDARAVGAKYSVSCSGITFSDFTFTSLPTGGLTITLNTDMPDGAEIRVTATAKHPLGTDGTNKFNKTGLPYTPSVTDTWVLRKPTCAIDMGDGWMRRTDQAQGTVKQYILDAHKPGDGTWKYEIKFREYPGGTFQSEWIPNVCGDANGSMTINLRPGVTGALRYDKDYEIKIRLLIVDKDGNIVWPVLGSTPEEEYIIQNLMKKVSVTFDSNMLGLTNASMNDEATAPTLNIQKGQIYEGNSLLKYNQVVGVEAEDVWNEITYVLEKKDASGNWVACTDAWVQGGPYIKMKFDNTGFSGNYRIKIMIVNQDKYSIDNSGNVTNLGKEDYILYDESTGNGIFYFNVNEIS